MLFSGDNCCLYGLPSFRGRVWRLSFPAADSASCGFKDTLWPRMVLLDPPHPHPPLSCGFKDTLWPRMVLLDPPHPTVLWVQRHSLAPDGALRPPHPTVLWVQRHPLAPDGALRPPTPHCLVGSKTPPGPGWCS